MAETQAGDAVFGDDYVSLQKFKQIIAGERRAFLPFKLQHDLLNIIQNLIEQACFYFTQKWLPGVLEKKGWETPEQGELTAWWNTLKDRRVPLQAVEFRGSGLAAVFQNCTRIRNNAVHRSRVSIPGIKAMLRDAVQLVSGLKDVPREAKLRRLQDYLERRDLEALRRSIDELLESSRLLGETFIVPISNGHADIMNICVDGIKAGEILTGSSKETQTALQLGTPPILHSIKLVAKEEEESGNGDPASTQRGIGGSDVAATHVQHAEVMKLYAQDMKLLEGSAINMIQPNLGPGLLSPNRGLEIYANDQDQRATESGVQYFVEDTRDNIQTGVSPKTFHVGLAVQYTNGVTRFTETVLENGSFLIDLTEEAIIDLTQDSDENSMDDERMDDDSVLALGSTFIFSEQRSSGPNPPARVMERESRRERKERRQKICEKKIRESRGERKERRQKIREKKIHERFLKWREERREEERREEERREEERREEERRREDEKKE